MPSLDPRLHDALADLYAYALFLNGERDRLGKLVDELTEELDALHTTIAALRAYGDGPVRTHNKPAPDA